MESATPPPTPSSDSASVLSSGQIKHSDRDRSHVLIFVHVIHVDPERVWRHRACWLLAVTLFVLLPLSGCASGARNAAALRATPTAIPTPRPRPTYPPCDRASQWQPQAGNIALDALSMVSPDEAWAMGEVNPDVDDANLPSAAVLYHLVRGQWQRLPQTYPGEELTSLSMDSPSDGLAVSVSVTNSTHPLVLHYTGGAWRPVDIPTLDLFAPGGVSIQMVGPQAGWMFATNNDATPVARLWRYEGNAWTVAPEPQVASTIELGPLVAVSADEAWMVGFDPNAQNSSMQNSSMLIYHFVDGGWGATPQTFPFDASLTMLSADDGWAVGSTETNVPKVLHYDGVRWAQIATPAAWVAQDLLPTGPVFAIGPGIYWVVTDVSTAKFEAGMGLGIWQYADAQWSPVAWPFPDAVPTALGSGAVGEEWGIGDIYHQEGCPPGFVADIRQGVFLHEVNGTWTREDLP